MQIFLTSFTYSRRSEAIFARGRDALLHLREEKKKLATKLRDASTQADISLRMTELENDTLKRSQDRSKEHADEMAKLWKEPEKERAVHAQAKIQ